MEMSREEMVARLAGSIAAIERSHPTRVAIDGPDAAGKSTLADELERELRARGRDVIRASIDGFHRPRAERYRRGADSPRGYFEDSFDVAALRDVLLDPLGPGGDLRHVRAIFDLRSDEPLDRAVEVASPDAVLLVDGVFLLRRELHASWDLRVFVSAGFDETLRRALERDAALLGSRAEVERRSRARYIPGQRLYFARCRPTEAADVVVVNDDPSRPVLLGARAHALRPLREPPGSPDPPPRSAARTGRHRLPLEGTSRFPRTPLPRSAARTGRTPPPTAGGTSRFPQTPSPVRCADGQLRCRAQILEHALLAARSARVADAAAVPDEEVREARPVRARHDALEVALDLHRIVVSRQPEPLREPAHVRVDDDALRVPELGGDDVRGLARDAGKPHEILEPSRHLAVELLEEHAHRPADRLRLLPEEAGRVDVALELLDRHGEVVLGPAVLREERRRDPVDVHVGRLRGEHHRDEQLEVAPEAERDLASACSAASRSTIGPIRSRAVPSPRRRASPT